MVFVHLWCQWATTPTTQEPCQWRDHCVQEGPEGPCHKNRTSWKPIPSFCGHLEPLVVSNHDEEAVSADNGGQYRPSCLHKANLLLWGFMSCSEKHSWVGVGVGRRSVQARAPWPPTSLTRVICAHPQGVQAGDKASALTKELTALHQEEMWAKQYNKWVSKESLGPSRERVTEREQQSCWLQHRL